MKERRFSLSGKISGFFKVSCWREILRMIEDTQAFLERESWIGLLSLPSIIKSINNKCMHICICVRDVNIRSIYDSFIKFCAKFQLSHT